eukprot:scaffold121818_cov20-Tisochrysis_lutea.AAC.2
MPTQASEHAQALAHAGMLKLIPFVNTHMHKHVLTACIQKQGNQLYSANAKYNLAAIAAESASDDLGDASYWGVALTKRSMCATMDGNAVGGPITGLDDSLRGKKACHTGYRKTSGWFLPVGKLADKGLMDFSKWVEEAANHEPRPVRVDAETVEKFWDDNVCAPGRSVHMHACPGASNADGQDFQIDKSPSFPCRKTAYGPQIGANGEGELYGTIGQDGGGLCKRCKTDCTSNSPYAGYDGALHCIDDEDNNDITGGDIAFVKHSTVRDYNGPALNTDK